MHSGGKCWLKSKLCGCLRCHYVCFPLNTFEGAPNKIKVDLIFINQMSKAVFYSGISEDADNTASDEEPEGAPSAPSGTPGPPSSRPVQYASDHIYGLPTSTGNMTMGEARISLGVALQLIYILCIF